MADYRNFLLDFILRNGDIELLNEISTLTDEQIISEYEIVYDGYDEYDDMKRLKVTEIEINYIDIGFNTKNTKTAIPYNEFVNQFKKMHVEKFSNLINSVVDITNEPNFDYSTLDYETETYKNIMFNVKTFYICLLTKENKAYIDNFVDPKISQKAKWANNYVLIFNKSNVYQINLKNKISTILEELEASMKANLDPNIIDSNEFIQEIKSYVENNNSEIIDLTQQITNISINSKVDMYKTFINKTASKKTKKYLKYVLDIKNLIAGLDKKKNYVCNTTSDTFYFVEQILEKYDFPYNCVKYSMQNCVLVLSPKCNMYLNTLDFFTGIDKTRINVLFEKIFQTKDLNECCICYKKSKKSNICYTCYQFNGCVQCGKKLFKQKTFDCVLCKS